MNLEGAQRQHILEFERKILGLARCKVSSCLEKGQKEETDRKRQNHAI